MEKSNALSEKIDKLNTDPQIKEFLKSLTKPEVQQRVRDLQNLLQEIEERNKPDEVELIKTRDEMLKSSLKWKHNINDIRKSWIR